MNETNFETKTCQDKKSVISAIVARDGIRINWIIFTLIASADTKQAQHCKFANKK